MTIDGYNSIESIQNVFLPQQNESGETVGQVAHLLITREDKQQSHTRPLAHANCAYKNEIQTWLNAGGIIT